MHKKDLCGVVFFHFLQRISDECRLSVIVEATPLFCKVGAPHKDARVHGTQPLLPGPEDAVIVTITCQKCTNPGHSVQGLNTDNPDDFLMLVDKIKDFLKENFDKLTEK